MKVIRLNDIQQQILGKQIKMLLQDIERQIGIYVNSGNTETKDAIWLDICRTELNKILRKIEA